MYELYGNLQKSLENLETLDLFENYNIRFLPGQNEDEVHLVYDLKEKSPYFASASNYFDR
jgi:outer membrane protein assembly factor BamA